MNSFKPAGRCVMEETLTSRCWLFDCFVVVGGWSYIFVKAPKEAGVGVKPEWPTKLECVLSEGVCVINDGNCEVTLDVWFVRVRIVNSFWVACLPLSPGIGEVQKLSAEGVVSSKLKWLL